MSWRWDISSVLNGPILTLPSAAPSSSSVWSKRRPWLETAPPSCTMSKRLFSPHSSFCLQRCFVVPVLCDSTQRDSTGSHIRKEKCRRLSQKLTLVKTCSFKWTVYICATQYSLHCKYTSPLPPFTYRAAALGASWPSVCCSRTPTCSAQGSGIRPATFRWLQQSFYHTSCSL